MSSLFRRSFWRIATGIGAEAMITVRFSSKRWVKRMLVICLPIFGFRIACAGTREINMEFGNVSVDAAIRASTDERQNVDIDISACRGMYAILKSMHEG